MDVDLERERCPGLQADMKKAKLWIEDVVGKRALLPWPGDEGVSGHG
jgi:hypothetical protein